MAIIADYMECIKCRQDLRPFIGKAAAVLGRKNKSATGGVILDIERRGGTDVKREVERAQGTVDGFAGSNVFILRMESVRRDANGEQGYYI